MKRLVAEFPVPENLLQALLSFSRDYNPVMILNSNRQHQQGEDRYASYDLLAAIGITKEIRGGAHCFPALQQFLDHADDWVFGAFTYDLKNQLEKLHSSNPGHIAFPDYHFFCPRYVLAVPKGSEKMLVHHLADSGDEGAVQIIYEQLTRDPGTGKTGQRPVENGDQPAAASKGPVPGVKISSRVTKEQYIAQVNRIKQHIRRGDIYEMNYCMEFYSENAVIDPAETYFELNELSPMPFSCFYRLDDQYLLCASPERFLKKSGNKIISQPIKGTARRGGVAAEDGRIKEELFNDPKERAENVMIVDLVRNDLSRTAIRGSVTVEELFGIYTFQTLHQMISTVVSEVEADLPVTEIIRAAFPMGSMTGAPKIKAMQLIEELEQARRGLYSGAAGYFAPADNRASTPVEFDLNVVIRSVLYDERAKTLSFMAGSAITANSDAAREYEECLLKARTIMKVLTHD